VYCCRSPHSGTVDTDDTCMMHAEPSLHGVSDDLAPAPVTAATDFETSSSTAPDPATVCTESDVPSAVTQSAVYEAPGADGLPVYRGYQDPNSQSASFKKLQNLIESGEGKRSVADSCRNQTIY